MIFLALIIPIESFMAFGSAFSTQIACHLQRDRFHMGFLNAKAAPICQDDDDSYYVEKQCFDAPIGTCTCVDTESGDPLSPTRAAPYKYKDVLVCSGTACLDEIHENNRLAQEQADKGMEDLPYIPRCTGSGLYNAVQSDPVTSKKWCTGPHGEYRREFGDDISESNEVTHCRNVYSAYRIAQQKAAAANGDSEN